MNYHFLAFPSKSENGLTDLNVAKPTTSSTSTRKDRTPPTQELKRRGDADE